MEADHRKIHGERHYAEQRRNALWTSAWESRQVPLVWVERFG